MLFRNLVDEWLGRFKNLADNDGNRIIAKRKLNLAYKEIYRAFPWEFRKRTGNITLIPNYTTGTCSTTGYDQTNETAARIVTFSGATLTAAMQGRYLQPKGSSNWYKISYVDTANNQVILETPILEASVSAVTFIIWKRFYYVNSEVDMILEFGNWIVNGELTYKSTTNLIDMVRDISATGQTTLFSPYGVDPYEGSYSTGTISVAASSNLMVGTGTAWTGNVTAGDRVTIGTNVYHVKRVESDTRIILLNYISDKGIASGSAYLIERDNPLGFQFYNNSSTYAVIPYTYYARAYDLVNEDKDRTALPDDFDPAILDSAQASRMGEDSDPQWVTMIQIAEARLTGLKNKRYVVKSKYRQFAPKVVPQMPGRST